AYRLFAHPNLSHLPLRPTMVAAPDFIRNQTPYSFQLEGVFPRRGARNLFVVTDVRRHAPGETTRSIISPTYGDVHIYVPPRLSGRNYDVHIVGFDGNDDIVDHRKFTVTTQRYEDRSNRSMMTEDLDFPATEKDSKELIIRQEDYGFFVLQLPTLSPLYSRHLLCDVVDGETGANVTRFYNSVDPHGSLANRFQVPLCFIGNKYRFHLVGIDSFTGDVVEHYTFSFDTIDLI
ncbi:hypothetical protein PMAYCL1PPCAC_22964, partial [Pristionchus mayeri]